MQGCLNVVDSLILGLGLCHDFNFELQNRAFSTMVLKDSNWHLTST